MKAKMWNVTMMPSNVGSLRRRTVSEMHHQWISHPLTNVIHNSLKNIVLNTMAMVNNTPCHAGLV